MDPTLIQNPDLLGIAVFFSIMALILGAAMVLNRSKNGDWIDEAHGQGSIEDDWGLR